MTIRSKQFEKNMKLLVRAALIENPRQLEVSLQKRKAVFWNRVFKRFVGSVLGAVAILFLIMFANVPVIGKGLVEGKEFNGIQLSLAFSSLLLSGLTAIMAGAYRDALFNPAKTIVFSHLPISDDEYYRRFVRKTEFLSALALGSITIPVYTFLAWEYRLGIPGLFTFLSGTVLHTILGRIMLRKIGKRFSIFGGLTLWGILLVFPVLIVSMAGLLLKPDAFVVALPIFLLTPAGWINGFLFHGYYSGNLWGWLFLLPVVGILYFNWKGKHSPYRIREFHFFTSHRIAIALEPGFATPLRQCELPAHSTNNEFQKDIDILNRVLRPEDARKIILDRSFLDLQTSQSHGWLQRKQYACFNRRNRILIDALCLTFPTWFQLWKWFGIMFLSVTAVLLIPVPEPFTSEGIVKIIAPLNLLIFLCFLGCVYGDSYRRSSSNHRSGLINFSFPISFWETTRVTLLWTLTVACLFIPMMVFLGLIISYRFALNPVIGITSSIAPFFTFVCSIPIFMCFGTASFIINTKRISLLHVWMILSVLIIPGLLILLMSPWSIAGAISAIVVPLASFGMWRYFDYLIHHTKVDFRLSTGGDLRR